MKNNLKWFIFPLSYISSGDNLGPSSADAKGKTEPPVSETMPHSTFLEDKYTTSKTRASIYNLYLYSHIYILFILDVCSDYI